MNFPFYELSRSHLVTAECGRVVLTAHIGHHVAAIEATAKKDWSREAGTWDPMLKHIYVLSDALAEGIAKHFPDKFRYQAATDEAEE